MNIEGDEISQFNLSLNGNGIQDITVNSLNEIPASTIAYLDATSSIQTQFNNIVLTNGAVQTFTIGNVSETSTPKQLSREQRITLY